ncbi:MAG TPA: hypothetical protein VGQ30_08370 [Gemmatimonadaceae bacterium]|nr:hypothetical protein [Gemmatimonadaceae bacterium]
MIRRILALVLVSCAVAAAPCNAQTSGVLPINASVSARLRDGTTLIGRLSEQTTDSVQITTASGRFMVARSAISELRLLSATDIERGAYWAPDPHDTRMFFGPTGRTLAAGTGYFSDTYILLFNAAVGITDRIMIGAGMSVIPFPDFLHDNLYYVAPKFALVRRDSFNLAVGAIVGFSGRLSGNASIYYIAATNGGPDASFTYGLGYASAAGTVNSAPLLMLSGEKRMARKLALMTENYFIVSRKEFYWAPVYGVRFIGDRLSTDLGFVNYVGHNAKPVFPGVPWLGFALKF